MNARVQAGLAVASGLSGTMTPADFSNVLIEPLSASYAEWQNWTLTRRGVTDPAVTSGGFDADGDTRVNQTEYWLGSDPLAAEPAALANALDVLNGTVRCHFTERQNAAQLGRVFLYSANLANWNPITPNSITVVEDSGAVVTREVTFSVTATAGFYRSSY
jgi:hypothetical protein